VRQVELSKIHQFYQVMTSSFSRDYTRDRLTPMEQAVTISIRARLASISISSTLHRQSISHVNTSIT
jgi:hypothetical protein